MPSLRHSYTVTAAEEPASLPGSERANLRRKSPPLSRTKLVSTFMGLIINQAKGNSSLSGVQPVSTPDKLSLIALFVH
ncbi:hypothetical protein KUCAC02_031960 [Chaenocephalus aceratus]|nr:hypothetical protein KUCAC02_031960 [Chaenocephalus aceratus]